MTSNKLKIIAIISMLIDHFAYYFYNNISIELYTVCRVIGRVAMPIFVYLLVQGYFNTKSLRKYKIRLFVAAIITQITIMIMKHINDSYYSTYVIGVYEFFNILFSLLLSLILICLIDRKIIYANTFFVSVLDKLIRLAGMILIVIIYIKIPFDYDYFVPILAVTVYIVEKVREFYNWDFKNFYYKIILGVVMFVLLISSGIILSELNFFAIFSVIFILLYNGKLEKKSKILKYVFYYFFPFQHIVFYFLAMVLQGKLV